MKFLVLLTLILVNNVFSKAIGNHSNGIIESTTIKIVDNSDYDSSGDFSFESSDYSSEDFDLDKRSISKREISEESDKDLDSEETDDPLFRSSISESFSSETVYDDNGSNENDS
uniref:Secreted phosphoprotein 1 n=1 Tax=Parastrongyloides trichosuri TaxID=131310 RepID=A0A0N4ZGL3_PARTI